MLLLKIRQQLAHRAFDAAVQVDHASYRRTENRHRRARHWGQPTANVHELEWRPPFGEEAVRIAARGTTFPEVRSRTFFSNCAPALHRARAEFVLARRDGLCHLCNRALETLLAVLDNPKSSPAVLRSTAMFILLEPAPDPAGKKLLD